MRNSVNNIGERIRIERLRANMTQAALAGDRISRNMLSMIESGAALPSLETLEYIANRLDVPAGIFFAEDEADEALFEKFNVISKAKALFTDKMYDECAEICKRVPGDDELLALSAECYIKLAEQEMDRFMLKSACEWLGAAKGAAQRCKTPSDEIISTADVYFELIKFASDNIDLDAVMRLSRLPSRVPSGVFVYLAALSYLDRGDFDTAMSVIKTVPCLSVDQMKYFKAKSAAIEFKFSAAIEMFEQLYESASLGFISKYRIAAEIESCYENRRDFESAYKYSSIKHHMLELFSK